MSSLVRHHGSLTMVSMTETGADHRILLLPNQDAVSFDFDNGDFVMAVSDGVGSCRKAGLGSAKAVAACVHVFKAAKQGKCRICKANLLRSIMTEWRHLLSKEDLDDCCATLKAVFKFGNTITAFSIGDGILAIESDGISMLAPVSETDFVNETNCLHKFVETSDFWSSEFHLDLHKQYAVLCCTDGVSNSILPGSEIGLLTEIEKSISREHLQDEIESLMQELSEHSFDDRTIGVIKDECTD